MKPISAIALISLATAVSSSCAETKTCTLLGYTSSVALIADEATQVASFCIDGHCVDDPGAALTVSVSDAPSTYEYTVEVQTETGPVETSGNVTTTRFEANGLGCGPVTANANLHVDRDGTVSHPPFLPQSRGVIPG